MKYKFDGWSMLEDMANTLRAGVHTAGFGLSFIGLEYINEKLGSPVQLPLPPETLIFSKEFGLYAAQSICAFGALMEEVKFGYNTLKVPAKLVTGKYFKRKYSKKKEQEQNV